MTDTIAPAPRVATVDSSPAIATLLQAIGLLTIVVAIGRPVWAYLTSTLVADMALVWQTGLIALAGLVLMALGSIVAALYRIEFNTRRR